MIGKELFGYFAKHLGAALQWIVHLGTKKYNDFYEKESSLWVGFIFIIIVLLAYYGSIKK